MSNQPIILIVTVTDVETQAVITAFERATGVQREYQSIGDHSIENLLYANLGTIDNVRFFLTRSEMGSSGVGGSQETVNKGISALSPIAVIMVGIAFGLDENKQSIGDVLVAKQVLLYGLQKVSLQGDGQERIYLRGDKVHSTPWLINRFNHASLSFKNAKVKFGLMIADDKLVDSIERRDQLLISEPEAIGGEMEGAGLYPPCQNNKVDWILVKSICDWAYNKGEEKESRQLIASNNAANFLLHALTFAPLSSNILTNENHDISRKIDNIEIDPANLVAQLEKYNNSQLKETINDLRLNRNHIHMNGTNYEIICDIIQILETKEGGLAQLENHLKKKMMLR